MVNRFGMMQRPMIGASRLGMGSQPKGFMAQNSVEGAGRGLQEWEWLAMSL